MQNTVVQYIATRPIQNLCEEAVRRPGTRLYKRWCEQEGLDLEGARATEKESDEGDMEDADGEADGVSGN